VSFRHTVIVLTIAIATALPAAAPALAAPPRETDATLRQDLAHLAAGAGGQGGFVVLDGQSGKTLAASSPDVARPLGSTAKLLTTGTAAARLGGSGLKTSVALTGPLAAGTLYGDLYLRGGGDPSLDETRLAALADQVAAGLRVITGGIVGDETLFDTLRGGPATNGAFDLDLTGVLGALTYDRGREAPGGPLQADPARATAFRFDDLLEARGVVIRGTPRAGVIPGGSVEIASTVAPVARVIKTINKTSDDFGAEILAKDLAGVPYVQPGTTAGGVAIITAAAAALGARVHPVDGSGVDRDTTGSPRQLARYVRRIRTQPIVARSLPIAGVDGTLAQRMTSGPARGSCRAKTGSLPQTRVSALAGWCHVHGRYLVFAFLRERVAQVAAKAAEDAMVQRVAASRRR